ncbi:hypothetical protein [Planktothrix rubescens]|uniref:hypothetical protein n=1 Tax=Planktothrix rubescens TaxID=59512 RepID=UPI0011808CCD|nr:hypothetical protein [Planktothrix rubescens]
MSIDTKPVLEGKIQGNSDKQNNPRSSYSREHRNTGTAPPQTPGLFQSQVKKSKERAIAT